MTMTTIRSSSPVLAVGDAASVAKAKGDAGSVAYDKTESLFL
jgi:hypothetical protein